MASGAVARLRRMPLSRAARELRRKACTCGKDAEYRPTPHEPGCPKYVDRSKAKRIREVLIEKRHSEAEGEWISLAEWHQIDLFALRLWQEWPGGGASPFHRRVSYEIKTSRSDFLAELRNPRKRAFAVAVSHQYWFACAPGIAKKHEIPPECGLVEVDGDGSVKIVKRAPKRVPEQALTIHDVVSLLRAKHLGPSVYEYREQATRASKLLKAAEDEHARASELVQMARVRLIREKGHLLLAGSEWVGPWSALPNPMRRKRVGDVRVRITSARVDERYEVERDRLMRSHNGTVYVKPVEEIERDGDVFGGQWLDPGDFLIAFRHEAEPVRVAPPADTSLHHRPRLRSVDA